MKNIFVIRHCKAAGQEATAPLTELGVEQAQQLASVLDGYNVEYVVSSPYLRAVDTIKPFCDRHSLELNKDDRLIERVLSTKEMTDWMDKLAATYIDLDLKFEGGESSNEAMSRGVAVIGDILAQKETNIAVVTHGALMSLILKHFDPKIGFEEWKKLSNPDVYHVKIDESGVTINRIWEPKA